MSETATTDVLPLRFSGLLLRVVAGLADLGVIWLFAWLVSSVMGISFLAATPEQLADTTHLHTLNAIVLFFAWLYCAGLESSPLQATLGMAIMGLYTADPTGGRVGLGRTTIRFWMRFIFSRAALALANAVRVCASVRTTGLPPETTLGVGALPGPVFFLRA